MRSESSNGDVPSKEALQSSGELLRCNFSGCGVPCRESKTIVSFFEILLCGRKKEKKGAVNQLSLQYTVIEFANEQDTEILFEVA